MMGYIWKPEMFTYFNPIAYLFNTLDFDLE